MNTENRTLPPWFDDLVARATAADGAPPFSDQTLVDLRSGRRKLMTIDSDAAAALLPGGPGELELVVDPESRRRGQGRALLDLVLRDTPELLAWAHGDHPGSRALAAATGFTPIRTLLQLRSEVSPPSSAEAALARTKPFRPGTDDAAWLDLNARAFASHPEQGSLTQADLEARMNEPWFDADDFLLVWDGDELTAFSWMKVADGVGEFYVVGVSPDRQGEGLGRIIVEAGLARLAQRGIRTAALYVDGENTAAVGLYRAYGFDDYTIDVQYRRTAS